jgi:hypothetical protein
VSYVGGLFDSLQNVVATATPTGDSRDLARRLVKKVIIESRYTPPVTLHDPFAPGPPNPVMERVRPRVTVMVGDQPIVIEPYGAPGKNEWPRIRKNLETAGYVGAGLLAAFAIYKLV